MKAGMVIAAAALGAVFALGHVRLPAEQPTRRPGTATGPTSGAAWTAKAPAATAATGPASSIAASDSAVVQVQVFVSGRVQGVGFRDFTLQNARHRRLTGWVRNLRDGRVEAVIQGPDASVQELLRLMRQGPPSARVEKLEATPQPVSDRMSDFEIRGTEQDRS